MRLGLKFVFAVDQEMFVIKNILLVAYSEKN